MTREMDFRNSVGLYEFWYFALFCASNFSIILDPERHSGVCASLTERTCFDG
jgi:hypothetical protein